MTQMGKKGNPLVSAKPMTSGEFEAFYETEYPIVVKLLVFLGASAEEANDAAQKAMTDLYRRLKTDENAIVSPGPWVRRAAHRYFIKDRQRERGRLSREIQGGHPGLEAYADDGLTAWEDEQYIEHLLEVLTPTQRAVLRQALNGSTTYEIAEELGKREENIRQQLKNGRDRLKLHPEIAPRAPRKPQPPLSDTCPGWLMQVPAAPRRQASE
jgi:RNA polymerase sigma factor (sigma-70 family)